MYKHSPLLQHCGGWTYCIATEFGNSLTKEPYLHGRTSMRQSVAPTGISKRARIKIPKLTLKPGCHVYLFETVTKSHPATTVLKDSFHLIFHYFPFPSLHPVLSRSALLGNCIMPKQSTTKLKGPTTDQKLCPLRSSRKRPLSQHSIVHRVLPPLLIRPSQRGPPSKLNLGLYRRHRPRPRTLLQINPPPLPLPSKSPPQPHQRLQHA